MRGARLDTATYTLTSVMKSGYMGILDFGPYVPAIHDSGVIVCQATLSDGRSVLMRWEEERCCVVVDSLVHDGLGEIHSHPAISDNQELSFYARTSNGPSQAWSVAASEAGQEKPTSMQPSFEGLRLAQAGPFGPTYRHKHAFRGVLEDGRACLCHGVGAASDVVAVAGKGVQAFGGLPLALTSTEALLSWVRYEDGREAVCSFPVGRQAVPRHWLITPANVRSIRPFLCVNRADTAVCAVTLVHGNDAILALTQERCEILFEAQSNLWLSCRSALIDNEGRAVFLATPRDGSMGLYCGPEPVTDRIIGIRDALFGSVVCEFALNAVSINDAGQLAIRVKLENGSQHILLAKRS